MADFKSVVENCDGRAHRWRQSRFIGRQTFGQAGICGPLAAKWIKDRRHNINFRDDTRTQDAREEVMQLKLNQHTRPRDYVSEYLQLFGLHRHFTLTFPHPVSLSQLLTVVTSGLGYYFVGLSTYGVGGPNFGGHAFAIDMFDFKFFDPDFGQASFDNDDDLKRCFTLWFRLMYLNMHGAAVVDRYF